MTRMDYPHRRYNPLTRAWVQVSPHRARRPWLGQVEKVPPENLPHYDPACYLCPGNERAGGRRNPLYTSTFVFDNDFQALLAPQDLDGVETSGPAAAAHPLFQAEQSFGVCRVVCFSPRHDLTLPQLPLPQVTAIVQAWSEQTRQLGELDYVQYVQVFENKGAMMGCSNPHPHSQVWAVSHVPDEPTRENHSLLEYNRQHGGCLLCDYLEQELQRQERLVAENPFFVALVPFWAIWPFEVLLLSRRHCASLADLDPAETEGLADILRQVTARYDRLFDVSFPYSMGFHQAPSGGQPHAECHLHAHFYPPLLRSATVRKFMVGYELLAMPQRDLTPETAAQRLRSVGESAKT